MSLIGSEILAGASGSGVSAYEIEQSLRFNSGDSTYLNWTPGSAGDRTLWTWSAWIKRSGLSSTVGLFGSYAANNNNDYLEILFASGNTLLVQGYNTAFLNTTQVFRDTSAWYHIVIAVDTSNATADDRIKIYVNGEQITVFATRNNPSSGGNLGVNQAGLHRLGRRPNSTDYFNGYMAEVNFIDGSALDHEDFGQLDDNGVWRPIKYAGSYTGNSFYLKFASGDGTDSSGLSNTWTANNFTTSGTGTDVMSDTPTTNWCTLNPLEATSGTLSNGNLNYALNAAYGTRGTFFPSTGKWYFEAELTAGTNPSYVLFGIQRSSGSLGSYSGGVAIPDGYGYLGFGTKMDGSSGSSYGDSFTTNDVIGVAYDLDAGKVWFSKNGTWQNSGDPAAGTGEAFSSITAGGYAPFAANETTSNNDHTGILNFGQRAFEYTPPTGFNALNTSNLPEPDIADGSDYFNTVTYSGNSSTQSITGVGFQPDLLWIKRRNASYSHQLLDAVRGKIGSDSSYARLASNLTNVEATPAGDDGVQSLDTDGFTTLADESYNETGGTYVAWNWLAANGTETNTAGSRTSTVSVNPTAGFSIVNFTGTGSALTVGHGLGVAPDLMIAKNRDKADNWVVWHNTFDMDDYIFLESTQVKATTTNPATFWNNTAPTSTVVSVGANSNTNVSGNDTILYCFAEVESYSRIGSYTGNGSSDGPFVYCGFKPAFVMIKRTDAANDWVMKDAARSSYNAAVLDLYANTSQAEVTFNAIDFTSNGFKLRNSNASPNASGGTYVFACFASNPFGGSGVSPATAR